jgi:hypothetical protein
LYEFESTLGFRTVSPGYNIDIETNQFSLLKREYKMKRKIFSKGLIAAFCLATLIFSACNNGSGSGGSGEKELISIAITAQPTKTAYLTNDTADWTGLVVTATYDDGSTAAIAVQNLSIGGFNSSTEGTKTITVSYGGKSTTFTISVTAPTDAGSGNIHILLLDTGSLSIQYREGDGLLFNWTGAAITLSRSSNGNPSKVQFSAEGFDSPAWYVDDEEPVSGSSITILAAAWGLEKHTVTFTGSKNGVFYSRKIPFTVEK